MSTQPVPPPIVCSEEVRTALEESRAVVALETSVLAQGLPPPHNSEARARITAAVRSRGAVAAWIAVDGGAVRVGLDDEGLGHLMEPGAASKVARRDLPVAVAREGLGATTVSATLWAANRAGIEVAATGGIGGVHHRSGDVSADLLELARTPGLLVCSGPKSIVDPAATAERLEELGVVVVGYRCDRLPFFLVSECDVRLEHRVESPAEAAAVALAAVRLGTPSTVLLCNPIPQDWAMEPERVATGVRACEARAEREGVRGKSLTPFLLACLSEETQGASLAANLALLESNAALAAEVAGAIAASGARSWRSPS
ncbi:MAG: pseudouridine-5'-phosphate glycosidase [Actinomycetota bacterium]